MVGGTLSSLPEAYLVLLKECLSESVRRGGQRKPRQDKKGLRPFWSPSKGLSTEFGERGRTCVLVDQIGFPASLTE